MLLDKLICKMSKEFLYHIMSDLLADEILDTVVIQLDNLLPDLLRIELLHLTHNMSSCKLLNKQSSTPCSIIHNQRVSSTLVTEGSICLETVSL